MTSQKDRLAFAATVALFLLGLLVLGIALYRSPLPRSGEAANALAMFIWGFLPAFLALFAASKIIRGANYPGIAVIMFAAVSFAFSVLLFALLGLGEGAGYLEVKVVLAFIIGASLGFAMAGKFAMRGREPGLGGGSKALLGLTAALLLAAAGASYFDLNSRIAETRSEVAKLEARAEAGEALAQISLGEAYHRRSACQILRRGRCLLRRLPYDPDRGKEWLRMAAAQADSKTYMELGRVYRWRVMDFEEAIKWYRLAADAGVQMAVYNIGSIYDRDLADFGKAFEWYSLAAEKGEEEAARALGNLYAHGRGVPQDDVLAYFWYIKYSNPPLWHDAPDLLKRITDEQVAKAERLHAEWLEARNKE